MPSPHKDERLVLRVSAVLLENIDEVRGHESRSNWVRRAIDSSLQPMLERVRREREAAERKARRR